MGPLEVTEMLKTFKCLIGKRQTLRVLKESCEKIRCVVLAQDAEKEIIEPVLSLCKKNNIKYYFFHSKRELGIIAGLKVDCSMISFQNQICPRG